MQQGPYLIPAGAPPGTPLLMEEERPPEAVYYFRIYAVLMILCLMGGFGASLYYGMLKPALSGVPASSAADDWIAGMVFLILSTMIMVPHVIALFGGRRRWVYTLSMVLIGLNMLWNTCCLPITIPLLIAWMKPETKRWYGAA